MRWNWGSTLARSTRRSWQVTPERSRPRGSAPGAPDGAAEARARCWSLPRRRSTNLSCSIPDYFFGRSPEHAFVQPDNLEILVNHLKCAAFELPIAADETFGGVDVPDLCDRLAEAGFLHRTGEHWHWTQEAYPADTVSLRSVTSDNFVIVNITEAAEVIGEVDFSSALTTVHPKAIYLHQGQQFHVEALNFEERKAYVKRVDVDYYTDAIRYTQVRVLECAASERIEAGGADAQAARSHGDVLVRSQVIGFKKIKFFTNENVGDGKLELPENEMHTTAFWLTLERPLWNRFPFP